MRKYEAIDIMKLYSDWDNARHKWNAMLRKARNNHEVEKLKAMRYGLQAGMSDLAKKGLNHDEICLAFIRLQRSIELVMKMILREQYPMPHDDPRVGVNYRAKHLEAKRKRDLAFQNFLRNSSY